MSHAQLVTDRNVDGQYRVESILKDGGCEVAIFSGPNALDRAVVFAGSDYYSSWSDEEALAGI